MTIQYSQKNTVTEPILTSISQDVSIISVTEITDEVKYKIRRIRMHKYYIYVEVTFNQTTISVSLN